MRPAGGNDAGNDGALRGGDGRKKIEEFARRLKAPEYYRLNFSDRDLETIDTETRVASVGSGYSR